LFGLLFNRLDFFFSGAVNTQLHGAESKLRKEWNGDGVKIVRQKPMCLDKNPCRGRSFPTNMVDEPA